MSYLKPNLAGVYDIPSLNASSQLYIKGKKFQEYLEDITSQLTEAEVTQVKQMLEYLDITGLNSAWSVTNSNINETLRSAITALQTKLLNIDTTALSSPSILNDANKNSALKTAIDTLITDLTAFAVRVTTEEGNVDNLQTKTAFLDTTALTQTSVLTNDNRNSVLKTALDALSGTPGDVTALAGRVTTAEGDIDALEGRATSLEGRATAVEGRATAVEARATTLEGKTQFTSVSNTYFDNNSGTAQPFGIPFGDFDGSTYPIGSFKMEVGPTLNQAGEGKSYFEITHKNLVQNPNFPAGDVAQAQFSNLLRCAGIRSYYRKGATPGIYNLSNETFLQHTDENGDGRVTMKAKVMRILPPDTNSVVEIGRFGESWSNPDIRIGGKGNQVNIGSMEDDELAQGVGDVATKTRIYIGRRPTTGNAGDVLNSQLILRGDCFTGNLNFKDLAVTAPLSLETLIALLSPSGLPSFLFSSLFGGGLSIPKSDVVVMKGTLSKRGDIETSNALSIEKMSIINTSVGNLTPGFTMFFAQHDVTSTQLIGNNRTGVFQGEISLKNYNVVSTGVDFVSSEENDLVNVLSIKGNSGILLHQGASSNNESLDIFNSKSGPIRLFIGQNGTRAGTTHGGVYIMRYLEPFGNNLVATGETKVILGSRIGIDSALASEAYQGDGFGQGKVATDAQLVIEPSTKVDTTRRQGINVRHKTIVNNLPVYTQSIINSDSISTPSVEAESMKITANYGGNTSARLYKDANNALYWNGALVTPAEAQTLGAVMTLGNTASTTLNMNNNGITNVASIQNWNVKDITAGTNISVTPNAGNYLLANTAPVQNVVAGSGGITIDIIGTTATINHIGIGGGGGGGGSQTIHDLDALEEVGAFQQAPSWGQTWNIADSVVSIHFDMYCSVDGKVIASASAGAGGEGPVRYSTNYGSTWSSGNTNVNWRSITGTSSGSKLFAIGYLSANPSTYVYYTSTTQGATWTSHNITSVTNSNPTPTLSSIRSSGDGTHLIMTDSTTNDMNGGRLFVSANGGSSWTLKTLTHSAFASTRSCALSRSGRYQYAILRASSFSAIHRSTDFGVTWTAMFNDSAIIADGASFIRIECDSTGRYVYVTRVNISTPGTNIPMYQSADFGVNWTASPVVIAMTDVWVSGTGQFIGAMATPTAVGGETRFYYSVDYGRNYAFIGVTTLGAGRCIAGSGDGSTLAVGSVNVTDYGFSADGKIRVSRVSARTEIVTTGLNESAMINGIMNITPAVQLWGRGQSYELGTNGVYICPIQNAKILLSEYNIGYKIEFYWNHIPEFTNQQFNYLGLQNATSVDGNYGQNDPLWSAVTNMNFVQHPETQPQTLHYLGRSYCGFQNPTNLNQNSPFRYSTILSGELSVNNRPENQQQFGSTTAPPITSNDWSPNMKVLRNEYRCDNYTSQIGNGTYPYDWGIRSQQALGYEFQNTPLCIKGTSLWDLTYAGNFYNGGSFSMQNGISQIFIMSADNVNPALRRQRGCYMKYQIYRIRK